MNSPAEELTRLDFQPSKMAPKLVLLKETMFSTWEKAEASSNEER